MHNIICLQSHDSWLTLWLAALCRPSVLQASVFVFTFRSSGMKILRAFLIMGCGFSSSAENLRLRGSKISCPGTLERARSAGSGSYLTGTWMESGSMGLGVSREGRPEGERPRQRREKTNQDLFKNVYYHYRKETCSAKNKSSIIKTLTLL